MSNQGLLDARSGVREAKHELVDAMAYEQRMYQRYSEASHEADRWKRRAELAVGKGVDDLARAALARSQKHASAAGEFHRQYLEQKGYVERMKARLLNLEARERGGLAALPSPAEIARVERNLIDLERLQDRAWEERARLAALAELERDELAERLEALEREDQLERQLAELKRQLNRG